MDRQPMSSVAHERKGLSLNFELQQGGILVLHCEGNLVRESEARKFSTTVSEVLPSAQRMVIDLSGVKGVDSAGLSELVMTHMWAEAAGFALKFSGPNKTLRDLFELTNLVSVFDIFPSVPQAVNSMDWKQRLLA